MCRAEVSPFSRTKLSFGWKNIYIKSNPYCRKVRELLAESTGKQEVLRNSGSRGERRGTKAVEFVEGCGAMLAQGQQSTHLIQHSVHSRGYRKIPRRDKNSNIWYFLSVTIPIHVFK